MKNIGGSYGGELTAGLFLQEFVDGAPWVHLDIAGPARANADDGYLAKGGTGFGVRTLVELARAFEAPGEVTRRARTRAPGGWRSPPSGSRPGSRRRASPRCTSRSPSTSRTTRSTRRASTSKRARRFGGSTTGATPTTSPRRRGRVLRQRQPEARPLVRAHVRRCRDVRVLLHAARHADQRPARRARRRRRRDGHAGRAIVGASDAAAPTFEASGRTIRVPADAETIQAAVDRAKKGDLVLVSPGVYKESVTIGTDGIVLRGVDRNRTILDGEFKRANGVFVVGADGVAVENLTARNFTENGFFWNGVLGYRGFVPHRVPQRRLRRLRVRLPVRTLRPLVRVGQPRLRLLHRPVQPVPRRDHRRRVRVQPARVLRLELVGRPVPRELRLVAQPHRHRAQQLRRRGAVTPGPGDHRRQRGQRQRRPARDDRGTKRPSTPRFGVGIVIAGGQEDVITKNRIVDNSKVGIALAPSVGLQDVPTSAEGNRSPTTWCEGSGLADLAVILPSASDGNCFSANTSPRRRRRTSNR